MGTKPFNKEKHEQKEVKVGDIVMHGDVVIERVATLPDNFQELKKSDDDALAYGEATGHIHQLFDGEFDLRIDPENENNRVLRIIKPTSLKHQEHMEVLLPPGDYRSRIQREYDPFTKRIREVAD